MSVSCLTQPSTRVPRHTAMLTVPGVCLLQAADLDEAEDALGKDYLKSTRVIDL